ncbi:MAG: hypothetical protein BMS9Abin28_1890 [Anaerolineae bacterium]|nr:MAG: hypothetical protein BMS9Abin28_1890 [Anaerolineae bacterium]
MRVFIAIALILALLVTVFAVQNNQPITISFLFWSIDGSLALVLMITLVLGIVIGVLLMAPGSVRSRIRVGDLQRSVHLLEQEKASEAAAIPPESAQPEAEAGDPVEDK